ncbi:ATP-binding cassette domain-containing protein [Candidatus Parcubacteria bacterium]|nr:ATP-binding cassette domain-containing protein [Patescibacteria group bacterium]MCG2694281.1 ATP-binding cassette domain-containing protein [Candidatus Parcubacteria bacterium]
MIEFKNVSKIYPPDFVGVKNISLRIQDGEFVSVIGKSGSGKTTLVKLLMAEEPISHGELKIGDVEVTKIKRNEIPSLRRQIGAVFQDYKLLPRKTIFENVAYALEVCGINNKRIGEIVPQVLRVVGLEGKEGRYPLQISGGEQQRAAIARALVHSPKLLVADEPTGNLDALNTQEIIELLKKINSLGTTVLLVTHNREVVNALKKRVVTLDMGMVVGDAEHGRYKI